MSRWWRAYDDALHDPKVQALPPALFKFWFNILCAASKNDGVIPPLVDLKALLKARLDHVETHLKDLLSRGLVDEIDGRLEPHNWRKRQYKSDNSTDRVRAHRNGKRNVSETPPDNRIQNTEKIIRADARSGGSESKYAFEGVIVRLTHKHFDEWTRAYSAIDLRAELVARDAWLADRASEADRKSWFISTSKYLANRNMEARAAASKRGGKVDLSDPREVERFILS